MKTGLKSRFKTIVMLFCLLFQVFAPASTALAEGTPKEVKTTITSLNIQRRSGDAVNSIFYTERFYLTMDWDASQNRADLKEGDYFTVSLPDQMKFPSDSSATNFDLLSPDGSSVVAKAHVTPNPDGGGSVKVTFTNWVEKRYDVKGSMKLAANFVISKIRLDEENTFSITVGGQVTNVKIRPNGPTDIVNEKLNKWGLGIEGIGNRAKWDGRINHEKGTYPNAVFTDTLVGSSEKFIKDSFKLEKVTFDSKGRLVQKLETIDLKDKIAFSDNDQTVTIKLGNINGEQYSFTYQTTYTPYTVLKNKAQLISEEKIISEYIASHQSSSSGGTGSGDLTNKIKIIKVDAENQETKLANAKFKITRISDGEEYEITTDAQGEAVTEKLVAGQYKIKELTAPNGFELNPEEITVDVVNGQAVIKTITNKPIKTSVNVDKKWVGPAKDSATVRLYADDADTGKTATLNASNSWKATFNDLRKFHADGKEIKYTIKEDAIENYQSEVTGDMASGFTVTNTNIEKVSVPVTKTWNDNNDQDGKRPQSITVNLLADGKVIKSQQVTAENDWKYTFTDLPKYANGKEIVYTVEEVKVDGYETKVEGTNITNTHTPETTQVSGTKTWNDNNDQDGKRPKSITVNLLADGKPFKTQKVTAENNWKYTFTDLPKYANGKEIVYTVSEEKVDGYEMKVEGTNITNTHTPETTQVSGAKTWNDNNDQDGKRPQSITVNLLADGKVIKSQQVTAENDWKYTFTDLPKYANGKEIVYTVTENAVEGYT
ncbi:Cna B-type domain-containing protein, partial [Streptococcus ruminantium]|uniref:Cna B-type domain-containing protein n=1 Tax=Streptococcus ruminantium TaxID=1917441 RepID=UPI0013EF4C62